MHTEFQSSSSRDLSFPFAASWRNFCLTESLQDFILSSIVPPGPLACLLGLLACLLGLLACLLGLLARLLGLLARLLGLLARPLGLLARLLGPLARPLGPLARLLGPLARLLGPLARLLGPLARPLGLLARPLGLARKVRMSLAVLHMHPPKKYTCRHVKFETHSPILGISERPRKRICDGIAPNRDKADTQHRLSLLRTGHAWCVRHTIRHFDLSGLQLHAKLASTTIQPKSFRAASRTGSASPRDTSS